MLGNKFALSATLFLAVVAVNGSAMAAPLKILGFEDDSCASWVQSKDDQDQRREFISWARGFLSGPNYANQRQQVSDVSNSTVELYIERFCRQNPKARFIEAVYRMSDQYSGRNAPIAK